MQSPSPHGGSFTASQKDAEHVESISEESDPSGRYIRYNEVVGRGAFKTVYRGFDAIDGIEVAWNQIKLQDVLDRPGDLERLYSEVHLLKTLKHKNIIKFYHSWVDTKARKINFITEFFTSGTLRQYCKRHKRVNIKAVKNWCRQILRGLLYLHSHDPPIIHRDLKCDNIFVNGNQGEVKIGDLGLAAILVQSHSAHSIIGTPEFMAPELYEEQYNELVDIYSFGMCLLEMVTFEYPYSECMNAAQIFKKVTSGIKPAALSKVEDKELRRFVEKCLARAPHRQPARELLMDPFLQPEPDDDIPMAANASNSGSLLGADAVTTYCTTYCRDADMAAFLHHHHHHHHHHHDAEPENASRDLCHAKEERSAGRNMAFRLKGKRREDQTVHLRLRIAEDGEVRVIHFPFDVEGDTAMCVASEMVQELDLEGQDVIKLADMIDSAVLLVVPEWKPGVSIADHPDADHRAAASDLHCSVWSDLSTLSSDSYLCDHGSPPAADAGRSLARDRGGISATHQQQQRSANAVHGRFEEVTYHHDRRCRPIGYVDLVEEEEGSISTSSASSASAASAAIAPDRAPADEWALFHVLGCVDLSKEEEDDDGLMRRIRCLALRYRDEAEDLRRWHEDAILEARKQWRHNKKEEEEGERSFAIEEGRLTRGAERSSNSRSKEAEAEAEAKAEADADADADAEAEADAGAEAGSGDVNEDVDDGDADDALLSLPMAMADWRDELDHPLSDGDDDDDCTTTSLWGSDCKKGVDDADRSIARLSFKELASLMSSLGPSNGRA